MSYFNYYLLAVNVIGFILFLIYMYTGAAENDESGIFDSILTIVALAFGSVGMVLSIALFGHTERARKKETMMSRVFISCILVIQIVIFLILKGYIQTELTFKFLTFFKNHMWLTYYLIGINIINFFLFMLDKIFALEGMWRIRIVTLLAFSFFGGSIGGLAAMLLFRHKTKKDYFMVGLPLMMIMQIVVIFYLMNI